MKTEQKIAPAALRRGIAFLCTLMLTLMAVTLPAEALEVKGPFDSPNIGLSYKEFKEGTPQEKYKDASVKSQGTGEWTADHTTITGTVKPTERKRTTRIGTHYYCCDKGASSTLTITNTSGDACLLTFSYESPKKDGTLTFVHNGMMSKGDSSGGTYSARLATKEAVTVTLTTSAETNESLISDSKKYTTTATLSNIEWTSMNTNIAVTLATPTNGSYTARANGEELGVGESHNMPKNTEYTFTASPYPEYNFVGWYVDGHKLSPKLTFTTSFNDSCTVEAWFVRKGVALFETGGRPFDDLNNAVAYAQANNKDKITLESDGKITGTYTIPAGITLLIPFDEAKTLYGETPTATRSKTEATPFRTLTMAAGSSITLARGAAISVGGQYYAGGGGQSGQMVGPYGYIKMESGSAITVQNGASLYAWGFISGSGSVTVESDGSVYEWYQILDFRGGSATSIIGAAGILVHVFPLSQYTVQNVEVPLTLCAGASETVYAAVFANDEINPTAIQFIGNNGMFKLRSGNLTKTYDASTDRLIYTINGEAEVNSLSLKLAGVTLDSGNFVLPFTSNMTVVLKSGSKLTMNQTAALLPGVEVSIAKNAELTVASGKSMYIYDVAEWGPYCVNNKEFVPVPYTPTPKGTRTLANATINVNGTLTAVGSIYTTDSGANICSSEGSGKFVQKNKPGTDKKTYQYDGSTKRHDIPITPAQLLNKDGSYTLTAGSSAGDTFTYCTCPTCSGGKWTNGLQVAAIINGNGEQVKTYATLQEAVKQFSQSSSGNTYIKLLHNTTEDINISTRDIYLDLNGYTVTGKFTMNDHILHGMDSSANKDYVTAPSGKIVGGVSRYARTYETPPVDGEYDRYVAILGTEADGETQNLSFHRFNISVTGYRFELAAPQCALIFCGKFQGDDAAKGYLKSLGFTLTGNNGPVSKSSEMSDALNNEFVKEEGGAYLFELYLKRSFEKDPPDIAYTEEFSATAQATFKNGGTQDSGTKDSKPQQLSFQKAWQNALDLNSDMEEKDQEILRKFLKEFGINIQAE